MASVLQSAALEASGALLSSVGPAKPFGQQLCPPLRIKGPGVTRKLRSPAGISTRQVLIQARAGGQSQRGRSSQNQRSRGGAKTAVSPAPAVVDQSLSVVIDNEENEKWTALKVETKNQPGLLTRITTLFRDLNLQVMRAEVDTVGDKVVDKFFIIDALGNKVTDPKDLSVIKSRLEAMPGAISPASTSVRPVGLDLERAKDQGKDEAARLELLHRLKDTYIRNDVLSIQESIVNHVEYTIGRSRYKFDNSEAYHAVAHSVRDRLIESWNDTEQYFQEQDPKRVSYLSMEFLMGRSLMNSLYNLNVKDLYSEALLQLGYDLEALKDEERDAALGNGGLGRLAACFLDSIATLNLPGWGYGIRYQYGMFRQTIENGFQHEQPDYWLNFSNPWEIERVQVYHTIKFYGHVEQYKDSQGRQRFKWIPGEQIEAVAYDNPVPGYGTNNTINLRLWAGKPSTEFDLQSFNTGDYVAAILSKQRAETISSVLYPDDRTYQGKELRLKQQHFMVSATLQDLLKRFKEKESDLTKLPEKITLQLNDTHPTIGVAEMMRLLMDEEGLGWTKSWDVTTRVFAFTNHTVLPEALEKWPVSLMERLLPRHMQIIYQINYNHLEDLKKRIGDDFFRIARMSIIEEGDVKNVRMAYLALVGSHHVNGVAAIHSQILRETIFKDFYQIWPEKFQNKTNGVTQRRWLAFCNPGLRDIISREVGSDKWIRDLSLVSVLKERADDPKLQEEWAAVKHANKEKLAAVIKKLTGQTVRTDALFDIQVKRIHEYKRQLMNMLSVIHRYDEIKRMSDEEKKNVVPRVIVVGGKAAPGYEMAKRIIKLVGAVGDVVNNDPAIGDLLKVFFLPDYNVSLAEVIIPASDLSQHISTAGTEASGTSNMKFAMNGGLIIGTLDGANVEIAEEIGEENMFIFGVRAHEVARLRGERREYRPDNRFTKVVESIRSGRFGWAEFFAPICEAISGANGGDFYLLANDFPSFLEAQDRVDATWKDKAMWRRMSILSTAGCAKFSSDRTIGEYANEIWGIEPCAVPVSPTSKRAPSK